SNSLAVASAVLYDVRLGFSASWQPQITSALWSNSSSGVTVSGSGFRGVGEGSGGDSQASPADHPVLELISINSGQALFLLATNWSRDSVICPSVSGLPLGYLMATVFVNGIPSAGQIFQ